MSNTFCEKDDAGEVIAKVHLKRRELYGAPPGEECNWVQRGRRHITAAGGLTIDQLLADCGENPRIAALAMFCVLEEQIKTMFSPSLQKKAHKAASKHTFIRSIMNSKNGNSMNASEVRQCQ